MDFHEAQAILRQAIDEAHRHPGQPVLVAKLVTGEASVVVDPELLTVQARITKRCLDGSVKTEVTMPGGLIPVLAREMA